MLKRIQGFCASFLIVVTLLSGSSPAKASPLAYPVLGNPNAPITVDEYVSLTCSHCAEFYTTILPQLEKTYVETGKVKFILRDFPLDGVALKAAIIARCMPKDSYYPFVKLLYQNQSAWAFGNNDHEKVILQYAKLGGLSDEKASACMLDTKLQDEVIAERTDASSKKNIEATPTFVINDGVEIIKGAQNAAAFSAVFDRLLANKK